MYQYCKSCGIKYPAKNQPYAGSQGLCPSCQNMEKEQELLKSYKTIYLLCEAFAEIIEEAEGFRFAFPDLDNAFHAISETAAALHHPYGFLAKENKYEHFPEDELFILLLKETEKVLDYKNKEKDLYTKINWLHSSVKRYLEKKGMLILPIKKEWFDMIVSGEKTEEYREIKPYWETRFQNAFLKEYNHCVNWEEYPINVIFRNGYSEDNPQVHAMVTIGKGTGRPEWGAEAEREYYVLKIHELW